MPTTRQVIASRPHTSLKSVSTVASPPALPKTAPTPKWHKMLDRMAVNPLQVATGSPAAASTGFDRGISRDLVSETLDQTTVPSSSRASACTVNTAIECLRVYECEKAKARAECVERRERTIKDGLTTRHSEKRKRKHKYHHHRHHHHSHKHHHKQHVPQQSILTLGGDDNRAKLEATEEREKRVEQESQSSDSESSKNPLAKQKSFGLGFRKSCADLISLLDDAYGSFILPKLKG